MQYNTGIKERKSWQTLKCARLTDNRNLIPSILSAEVVTDSQSLPVDGSCPQCLFRRA